VSEPGAARGSSADYCSAYPADGHHMVSHSAGRKVRWVERCQFCGWIDAEALDGWADNAIKESLSARAGRIAVATETEPFAFVQTSTEELPLSEILLQALAAAESIGQDRLLGLTTKADRRTAIYKALEREVEAALERTINRHLVTG